MIYILIYLVIFIPCAVRVAYLMDWPHPDDDAVSNTVVVVLLLLLGPILWLAWPARGRS